MEVRQSTGHEGLPGPGTKPGEKQGAGKLVRRTSRSIPLRSDPKRPVPSARTPRSDRPDAVPWTRRA
jgi:hypothetical protein